MSDARKQNDDTDATQHSSVVTALRKPAMNRALLLIDLQNDYFPGGAMELHGSLDAGHQARRLLGSFRRRGLPIFHIQHIGSGLDTHYLLPNTVGAQLHENLRPAAGESLIQKKFPNAFRGTNLLDQLDRTSVTQLVIAGMMTHLCVDTTTRAAADLGFECFLAHDACATRPLTFGGISVMAASVQTMVLAALSGVFATVSAVDELIASA